MYDIYMENSKKEYNNITELRKNLYKGDDAKFLDENIYGRDYIITRSGKIFSCKGAGRGKRRESYREIGLSQNHRGQNVVTLIPIDHSRGKKRELVHRLVYQKFKAKTQLSSKIRIRHLINKNDNCIENLAPELLTEGKGRKISDLNYYLLHLKKDFLNYRLFSDRITSVTLDQSKEIYQSLKKNGFISSTPGTLTSKLLSTMKVSDLPIFAQGITKITRRDSSETLLSRIRKALEPFQTEQMIKAEFYIKIYPNTKISYADEIECITNNKIRTRNKLANSKTNRLSRADNYQIKNRLHHHIGGDNQLP